MAFTIPFTRNTFRPPDTIIPGNSTDPAPVEFTLDPAGGADVARISALVYGDIGLILAAGDMSLNSQQIIQALESSRGVFIQTVVAITGLTVPAILAVKVGILQALPKQPNTTVDDPTAKIPISNGAEFDKVAPYMSALAMLVAFEIGKLTTDLDNKADPRFFVPPSGSGRTGTRAKATSTATGARPTSRRRATAGSPTR